MAALDLDRLDTERDGVEAWVATWLRALPALALVGPGSWFVAALVRAAGIGTLEGGLDWISGPEGLIMSLGVSFFAATYTLLGMTIARRAVRSGVAVTGLGLLGLSAFAGIAFFRTFMAKFTDEGLDPDAMNAAFEATHLWDLAAVTNFANFAAWLVAGIAVLGTRVLPRWVGVSCIAGVVCVVLAQGAYVALEVLWPLATPGASGRATCGGCAGTAARTRPRSGRRSS
jgi:hypothetical protein